MKISTESLRINRININGAELVYLCNKLSASHPRIKTYYNLIKELPEDIFHKIWSTPESYLWSKITWDLVHLDKKKSILLENYLDWKGSSADEQLNHQIDQLCLFILSGYVLMNKDIALPYVVTLPDISSLSGSGISWETSDLHVKGYVATDSSELLPNAKGKYSSKYFYGYKNEGEFRKIIAFEDIFFSQPTLSKHPITIDVWSECARMNFEGMEWIKRVESKDKINKFRLTAEKAMDYIKNYDNNIYNELCLLVNKIVPLKVISDANPSSSNSTILGIIFCTYTEDPLLLAEMLIHEFSHNKLFLFQEIDPLLNSAVHGDGWADQSYYSPWRSDPRPLNGILHGLYVFNEVASFWYYIMSQFTEKEYSHISFKRFYLLVEQLKIAINVLKSECTFTESGQDLINEINKNISKFDSEISKNDLESTSAHFSELDFDRELVGSNVLDAIKSHRKKWDKTNHA